MATVTAVIASTHHRFYYRASTATGEDRPPFADEWAAKIEPIVPIYTTSSPRRFLGRSGSSKRGHQTTGSRSSAPGTCRLSWAAPASSGRTALTRSSTARQSNGSPQAT